jgi:hypothetical protein
MAKAQVNPVQYENNGAAVTVKPLQSVEGHEEMAVFGVTLLRGKLKRANDRVKAISGGNEAVGNNAKSAIVAMLKLLGVDDAQYDVAAAVASIQWPEAETETGPKDWTGYEDAEELKEQFNVALEGANMIFKGEGSIRAGLREFGQAIARVAKTLEKPKHFDSWLKAAPMSVQNLLANTNAKAEYIFLGKLDQEWFDLAPESTISAKAFQLRFNTQKNDLAEAAAMEAYGRASMVKGKAKGVVTVTIAQEALVHILNAVREEIPEGRTGMTQRHRLAEVYDEALAEFVGVDFLSKTEEGSIVPATLDDGTYVARTLFGSGNRPNELVLAYCKALEAEASKDQRREEENAKREENEKAAAVKPRTFSQYGVTEAAYHLANILQAHSEWHEVMNYLDMMGDRVLAGEAWEQVLSDVRAGIDADAARAAEEDAEQEADDAA